MSKNNRRPEMAPVHGLKGTLGANRARGYQPSGYGTGDAGGQAGHVGLPHGAAGGGGVEVIRPDSHGLSSGVHFEGGVRGANVSEPETLPATYTVRKKGFDEHRFPATDVHGMDGVEGVHGEGSMDDGGNSTTMSAPPESSPGSMGMAGKGGHGCKTCGFTAKTAHGYARHIHAKHGYGKLGHGLTGHGMQMGPSGFGTTHGDSMQDQEFRGETEGPREMAQIRAEFEAAKPRKDFHSSYADGDRAGSYGKV